MRKTFEFGKFAIANENRKSNLVTVELNLNYHEDRTKLNYLDLTEVKGYYTLSISANIWNSKHTDIYMGGQCLDSLLPYLKTDKLFLELFNLWTDYHLNDLKSGTVEQKEALKEFKGGYREQCEYLKSIDLYEVDGFKYGHAWLLEVIPSDVIERVKTLLA